MAACEWCWATASERAALMGGSVSDRYHEVLDEQEAMGRSALCPAIRARYTAPSVEDAI